MADKPAFPFYQSQPGQGGMEDVPVPGMTYREWQWTQFAAVSLQKNIPTTPEHAEVLNKASKALGYDESQIIEAACSAAITWADAMIAAIEEREKDK